MKLTPRNTTVLIKYAELVGISPQRFLNRFLAEFLLTRFADLQTGCAKAWMGGFTFSWL